MVSRRTVGKAILAGTAAAAGLAGGLTHKSSKVKPEDEPVQKRLKAEKAKKAKGGKS